MPNIVRRATVRFCYSNWKLALKFVAACGMTIRGIRYKCMHPSCPDYDLCGNCEALPIAVHPSNHPMLKMRDPKTVIPTVYRVGGTSMINSHTYQCPFNCRALSQNCASTTSAPVPPKETTFSDASVSAFEPVPEKLDASVQLSLPETFEVGVSTVVPLTEETNQESEPASRALSPAPVEPFENFQLLVDYFRAKSAKQTPNQEGPLVTEPEMAQKAHLEASASENVNVAPLLPSLVSRLSLKSIISDDEYKAEQVEPNAEDGLVFPPGTEFVYSWRMKNIGARAWPESTAVIHVAGDRMQAYGDAPTRYRVGRVEPGGSVDVYAWDLKVCLINSHCNRKLRAY